MARMNLRTYSVALILIPAVIGLALTFSTGFLSQTDYQLEDDDPLHELRGNFTDQQDAIDEEEARGIDVQTDFFFLSAVWNVITGIADGLTDVLTIITSIPGLIGLNVPQSLVNLVTGVVTVGVIFAILSAARGWDV